MLVNGRTAIDCVSVLGSGLVAWTDGGDVRPAGVPLPDSDRPVDILDTYVTVIPEANVEPIADALCTIEETQIPPGSASGSKRAAMLTPSP